MGLALEDGVIDGPTELASAAAPMRILIYGLNFAPELTGIGRYTGNMAVWLAEQGHEVTVVTTYPYYPHWRIAPGYPAWRWSRETWRGVRVLRCPLWVPAQPNAIKRVLHLLSFSLLSGPVTVAAALWRRPDIVLSIEPATFGSPWAILAARLSGATSWLHVQDVELGAALRLGLVRRGWLSRFVAAAYGSVLRRFDRVTTLSERMRVELAQLGRAAQAIELFPNWVNLARFGDADPAAMRAELGLGPDDVAVLYAGNLGEKQGVESLLDVGQMLEDDPAVRLFICGAGATRANLEARLASHPNVTLLEPQPDERFVDLLHAADIHVLPQRKGISHFVLPSKLPAMMASGRAIVAQADMECAIRATLADCATVLEPEDVRGMAASIRALAGAPAERARLGVIARARVQHFRREDVLARAFRGLMPRRASASGLGLEAPAEARPS